MKEENRTCETCYFYEPDANGWGFCDKKEVYTQEDCQCPDCITIEPLFKEGEENGV